MKITQDFFTCNDCYNTGKTIEVKGLMLHSTAAPGVKAAEWKARWNKSYAKGETTRQACVHAFVDDKDVIQALPWNHEGWHAGKGSKGSANQTHIGVELCEPKGAVYNKNGTAFAKYDVKALTPYFEKVYQNAVALFAFLCKEYNLNPRTDIICHKEGWRKGIACGHADVEHWFPLHGKSMDDFREDTAAALAALRAADTAASATQPRYRVQVGAFADRGKAQTLLARLRAAGFEGYIRT